MEQYVCKAPESSFVSIWSLKTFKMIRLLLLFSPFFTFYAQSNDFPLKHQDFSKIILNEKLGFEGDIAKEKLEIKFETVSKDTKKPENYLVKGTYSLNGKKLECSGKLTFTSYLM